MGSYWDSNVYYNPESFGLEVVGSIQEEPDYDFHILSVWRHTETGVMYWATDSGCSCPTPFEDYNTLEDLNRLKTVREYSAFKRAVKDFAPYRPINPTEKTTLLAKVHEVRTAA